MSSNNTSRDSLFPATSIGRVPRTPSHESLTAHPLLAPSSPQESNATPTISSPYVPYTPRQRVSPSTTTGTTTNQSVTASPPHQHQGDATSKLQLMNLKAAAQDMGLDSTSVGWMILDKLVTEADHGPEWTEIRNALTVGKATLLLPIEQTSAHDKYTAAFLRDHVIYCEELPRSKTPLVTLSGLRGYLEGDTIVFRSSLHPSTKHFRDIAVPSTRSTSFATLPPLPNHLALSSPSPYPTFSVSSRSSNLPLPPRGAMTKPPLPPRPQARASATSSVSRLSNPFASLFGHKQPPSPNPSTLTPSQPSPTSPDSDHVAEISTLAINRKVTFKDVGREINRALRAEFKESLAGLPSSVIDRVHEFTSDFYPLIKASKKLASPKRKALQANEAQSPNSPGHSPSLSSSPLIVNPIQETPEDLSERFQDFYALLEEDLRGGNTPFLSRKRDDQPPAGEEVTPQRIDSEAKILEIMETVERAVCSLFYDRIFMQPTSDDASHDEALSGRVAALNMLDLGLEHLDIVVGNIDTELNLVVKACGETLTQLDVACRSPGDKAAVLVAAHKIVVDGLARLPPIRLKSQAESKASSALPTPIRDKPITGLPVTDSPTPIPQESSTITTENEKPPPSTPLANEKSPTIVLSDADAPAGAQHRQIQDDEPEPPTGPSSSQEENESPPPLPPRSEPARLSFSPEPPKEPTPVSGDVLLPMIIFSVVKANPPHLVSHLLFTQRFRNQSIGGEESYCLINLLAVAEFLENVDLAALGLSDSNKVMSTADLTPLPVPRSPSARTPPTPEVPANVARLDELRGKVGQGVDAANKVITGVVDSSFTILRSIITNNPNSPLNPSPISMIPSPIGDEHGNRAGFGLLRRQSSGFSLASIAASLPIPVGRGKSMHEETGQPLLPVSRPGSVKSSRTKEQTDEDSSGDVSGSEEDDSEGDDDGQGDEGPIVMGSGKREFDARSIRSFESMMSERRKGRDRSGTGRKSLTDRLAQVSGMGSMKGSPPSRRSSILPPSYTSGPHRLDSPAHSDPPSPAGLLRLAPPNHRFMECAEGDLKISEVAELLRDYRRLANGIRAVGGFEE